MKINDNKIAYIYNASGVKVQKKVTNGSNIDITEYLDGFQYKNQRLQFFPHAEGYVNGLNKETQNNSFQHMYDYAIGRFMSIDPLADEYNYQTPYAFAGNEVGNLRG